MGVGQKHPSTNLFETNFIGANLFAANLSGAEFIEANLSEAKLYEANLSGANLLKANLSGAKFSGANLSKAKNLSCEQLLKAKTLYNAKLDPELEKPLREKHPELFEEPKK